MPTAPGAHDPAPIETGAPFSRIELIPAAGRVCPFPLRSATQVGRSGPSCDMESHAWSFGTVSPAFRHSPETHWEDRGVQTLLGADVGAFTTDSIHRDDRALSPMPRKSSSTVGTACLGMIIRRRARKDDTENRSGAPNHRKRTGPENTECDSNGRTSVSGASGPQERGNGPRARFELAIEA